MKISKTLPQFDRFPALFITSGEYEAHFHVAFVGKFESVKTIKMSPRDEAKEKQAFVGHKGGMQSLSAVSHKGNYERDLKMRFAHNVQKTIIDLIDEYKLEEICVFAPKYVMNRLLKGLDQSVLNKVRMQFFKEYTKQNPIELIKIFNEELLQIQESIMFTPGKFALSR